MILPKKNIKNLVFQGGGVKGCAYAGSVQILDEYKLLASVTHVAGTSVGSRVASLVAIGAGSKGLTESILKSDFKKFTNDKGWILGDIYRLLCYYGIHSADSFANIMRGFIAQ